jgi:PadR family transcriptional regulator AphA
MTIPYAILGLLSWRSFTGYELKKVFADSATLFWSGNNNQIYTALVQLHKDGLVTQEVQYQESAPAKKIYTITAEGRAALKQWVLTPPELPEFRNTFLIQLTWADLLDDHELEALLASYAEEVKLQILMLREQARRKAATEARTRREAFLWQMTIQNLISAYENELSWLHQVQEGVNNHETSDHL